MKQITTNNKNPKLVIVTRRDIAPGYQAVQSAHSIPQFSYEHPEAFYQWYHNSNYLILLSVEDENALKELLLKASEKGIRHSAFTEPDINNQITSIILEPHEETYKLVSNLPLALKEYTKFHKKEKEVTNE